MDLLFDSHVGRGAFADVWLAKDALGRSVAVKFFNDSSPSQLERNALDHAKALARVRHPAVVQVLAVEKQAHPETGAESLCIIMEYAEGPNLSLQKSPLTMEHARVMMDDISGALQAIHAAGLVHGDLHEANIVVTSTGAKVIDILYTHSLAEVGTTRANKNREDDYRELALLLYKVFAKAGCSGPALEEAYLRAATSLSSVDAVQRPFTALLSRYSGLQADVQPISVPPRGLAEPTPRVPDTTAQTLVAESPGASPEPRRAALMSFRNKGVFAAAVAASALLATMGFGIHRLFLQDTSTSVVYDAQEQACKAGDQRACVDQGNSLYNGRGVAKDPARAVELFEAACEAGEPYGCLSRGWARYTGTGTRKDPVAAAQDFERACNDSTSAGCYGLGILYRDGTGKPKDPARAATLIKKACDAGFGPGCNKPDVPASGAGPVAAVPAPVDRVTMKQIEAAPRSPCRGIDGHRYYLVGTAPGALSDVLVRICGNPDAEAVPPSAIEREGSLLVLAEGSSKAVADMSKDLSPGGPVERHARLSALLGLPAERAVVMVQYWERDHTVTVPLLDPQVVFFAARQ